MNESTPATKTGLVLSDLHFLSRRSDAETLFQQEIIPQLSNLDTLVLNGDIFDFRWAGRPLSESIPWSIDWLHDLLEQYPHLEIYYVIGNHDCIPEFVTQLNSIERIKVQNHHLILGQHLFLHGDAANYFMDQARFERFRKGWENDQPRSQFSMKLYQIGDILKLSAISHHLYFFGNVAAKRIGRHLDTIIPGWDQAIEHCYFGHTHIPFKAYKNHQATFHNTGSAIRGMGFEPMNFQYQ